MLGLNSDNKNPRHHFTLVAILKITQKTLGTRLPVFTRNAWITSNKQNAFIGVAEHATDCLAQVVSHLSL